MNAFPHSSTTDPLPSTPGAPVTVTVEARGPQDFHVSARGGTWHDQAAAIVETLRDLASRGIIGPDAPTPPMPTVCPDCGEPMDAPGETIGRDHYLCRDCAAAFHAEQVAFAALLDAGESEAA